MKYTTSKLYDILIETVQNGTRHSHYDRTVELAKKYRRWITGRDQKKMIVQYKRNETDEQKEQRVEIYNSRTKFAASQVWAQFDHISRADNIIDNIYYTGIQDADDEAETRLEEINERLANFSDNHNLKSYLHQKIKYLNFFDPNAFIVVELENDDPAEKPWTYPMEVYSHQAIRYEYAKKELQYLIVNQKTTKIEKDASGGKEKQAPADLFYLYAADYAFKLQELGRSGEYKMPADIEALPEKDKPAIVKIYDKNDPDKSTDYAYWEYETKSKVNPAISVGYIGDTETNMDTYVGILEWAEELFVDLINTKSEYDLSKALHGFLQKYAYAHPCEYTYEDENGRNFKCDEGTLRGLNKDCPKCDGKGVLMHATVQDVHLIRMPDGKSEHIPLDQLVHYVEIPTKIIEAQKAELSELVNLIPRAVFNANPAENAEIVQSGVHKRLLNESLYNAFGKFGSAYSRVYKHCVLLTAIHLQNEEGLAVDHQFPKDFHLDTVEDLISQRKAAIDAGLPYVIVNQIDNLILMKQSQDNPEHIEIVRARQMFMPFREKSREERMLLINDLPDHDFQRLLYIHYEQVFDLIENGEKYRDSKKPFYRLNYDRQKEIVQEALEDIIGTTLEELKGNTASTPGVRPALGEPGEGSGGDGTGSENDPPEPPTPPTPEPNED